MKKILAIILSFVLVALLVPSFSLVAESAISLCYDDYYTFEGASEVTSSNSAVISVSGNTIHAVALSATPITVTVDGKSYAVTVKKSKINIIMVCGQSNAVGATTGTMDYPSSTATYTSTHIDKGIAYVWGANAKAPVAFVDNQTSSSGFGDGFRAAYVSEWYEQSKLNGDPQKTVVVYANNHTAYPGQTIAQFLSDGSTTTVGTLDKSVPMLNACYDYYTKGAGAQYFDVANCGLYWLQGESDDKESVSYYYDKFSTMWKGMKEGTANRLKYCAIMRVRKNGGGVNNIPYMGPVIAQYQFANDNADVFMASNLTEQWHGADGEAIINVDISNYHIFDEPQYNGLVSQNTLTAKLSHLYGGIHYTRLGFNLLGADAAYNMYRSLYKPENKVTFALSNGKPGILAAAGKGQTISADSITENGFVYAAPGSAATTVKVEVASTGVGGKDITETVLNTMSASATTGCLLNAERLTVYIDPIITAKTAFGNTLFTVDTDLEDNPIDFGSSPKDAVYYHWDFTDQSTYAKGLTNGKISTDKALTIYTASDSDAFGILKYSNVANPSISYSDTLGIVRSAGTNDYFTITNKDGGTGVILTPDKGFMMEVTAAFSKKDGLNGVILGKGNGQHPFFFKQSGKIYIGGSNPNANVSVGNLDITKPTTYQVTFDGSKYTLKMIQGEQVVVTPLEFNMAVPDGFFNWNYLFACISAGSAHNFIGSVSDIKFYTSYYYSLSLSGSSASTYTLEGIGEKATAQTTKFKVNPTGIYTVTGVFLNQQELTPDSEGYYTVNIRKDSDLKIITTARVDGHNVDEGTIIKAPTCTEDGIKLYTCLDENCGITFEENIPSLGHEMNNGVITTAPTPYSAGIKTYSCIHEGCSECYYEYISATEPLYYHWDFTDQGAYQEGDSLIINTAPDSQGVANMEYTAGAQKELDYSSSGLTRGERTDNYFTIYNALGQTGITLSLTDGFVLEYTASFPGSLDILLGNKLGTLGHPFVFRQSEKMMIGGDNPSGHVVPVGISMQDMATYRFTYDGKVYHAKITQGTKVFEADFTFSGPVSENFISFSYMFPKFTSAFNYYGTVKDLKLWTSYNFDLSATGVDCQVDIAEKATINADGSYSFTITPKEGYKVKKVTSNTGLLVKNEDGSYTVSYPTKDVSLSAIAKVDMLYGDANNDGKIDLVDLVKMKKYLIGLTDSIDLEKANTDFSTDNVITAQDLTSVIDFLLGRIKEI